MLMGVTQPSAPWTRIAATWRNERAEANARRLFKRLHLSILSPMPSLGRDIPGFYFDAARNRYFPKGRPAEGPGSSSAMPKTTNAEVPESSGPIIHGPKTPISGSSSGRCMRIDNIHSFRSSDWRRVAHQYVALRYANTSHSKATWSYPDYPTYGLRSFCVSSTDDTKQVAGDINGFVYTYADVGNIEDGSGRYTHRLWSAECGLLSPISSCAVVNDKFFASSFGPHPKVLIGSFCRAQGGEDIEGTINIIERRQNLSDVWCGSYTEHSFVLGMTNHLWFVPDLDNLQSARSVRMGSDALSLQQNESQLYAGFRNGSVHVFDTRLQERYGKTLLQAHTSVVRLLLVREWELLTALIDGSLDIYDLRMTRSMEFVTSMQSSSSSVQTRRTPLLSMEGHVSTFTTSQPIAVTPSHDFLFAAGEDNIIRAWSTLTGERLSPPLSSNAPQGQPTEPDRSMPLLAQTIGAQEPRWVDLHITEYEAGRRVEPRLWAATVAGVTRFDLGRRWSDYV